MNPALRDALSVLHPSREETHLLRACLWTGTRAREAWQAFEAEAGDLRGLFRADSGRRKRLGPLLAWALHRNGLSADPGVLTVLRTASLREELRAKIYHEILGAVLRALSGAGVSFLVTRGAALGSTLYETASLRHSHDIDLIIESERLEQAAAVLAAAGFRRSPTPGTTAESVQLTHATTLPVNLHSGPFEGAGDGITWDQLWSRRRDAALLELAVALPGPEDELLGILGHAAAGTNRASLQWACDAWLLLAREPDLDWARFAAGAARTGVTLPCWALISYLATGLDAPIRPSAVELLSDAASRAPAIERDRALFAIRSGAGTGGFGLVRRGGNLRARVTLFFWLLLPSAPYLRAAYGIEGRSRLPAIYLRRLSRYGLHVLRGRVGSAGSGRSPPTPVE